MRQARTIPIYISLSLAFCMFACAHARRVDGQYDYSGDESMLMQNYQAMPLLNSDYYDADQSVYAAGVAAVAGVYQATDKDQTYGDISQPHIVGTCVVDGGGVFTSPCVGLTLTISNARTGESTTSNMDSKGRFLFLAQPMEAYSISVGSNDYVISRTVPSLPLHAGDQVRVHVRLK